MKLKYIIGILVLLVLPIGMASAYQSFDMNYYQANANEYAKVNVVYDDVTYGGISCDQINLTVSPGSKATEAPRFTKVAVNIDHTKIIAVEGKYGSTYIQWYPPDYGQGQFDGFGSYLSIFSEPSSVPGNQWATQVRIILQKDALGNPENIKDNEGQNINDPKDPTFEVAAHVSWGQGDAGSSFFAGHIPDGTTPIPEFPSIALPVAAIIGIMFIVGRKKE